MLGTRQASFLSSNFSRPVTYYCYKLLFGLLARLPWLIIALMARILGFLLHRLLRYRRGVVYANLQRSFPEHEAPAIEEIARDFYHHLAYQFLASPRLLSQSPETIRAHHLQLEGLEVFEGLDLQTRRACIVLMGHCGAWELFSAGQVYFEALGYQQEQLYRPLKSKALDRVQREMRSRYGSLCTPKGEIGRRLVSLLRGEADCPHILAFIADQTPRPSVDKVWTTFLHQPTAFLDGAERLARKYDLPILYMDIERLAQRQYRGRMQLIASSPRTFPPGEITRQYAALLEQTIRRAPAYWLWSHRRWKHAPAPEDLLFL